MKLFHVTVEYDLVVLAETQAEAEKIGTSFGVMNEVVMHGQGAASSVYELRGQNRIPQEWRDGIPYGVTDEKYLDKTCTEVMEMCLAEQAAEKST